MIEIRDLLGVPFREGGRDKNGFDCYGVCIEGARRMGKHLNDIKKNTNHDPSLVQENMPTLNVKPCDKPKEGVILEMRFGKELHTGICVDEKHFLHASYAGVRVSRIGVFPVVAMYEITD